MKYSGENWAGVETDDQMYQAITIKLMYIGISWIRFKRDKRREYGKGDGYRKQQET